MHEAVALPIGAPTRHVTSIWVLCKSSKCSAQTTGKTATPGRRTL